MNTERLRLVAKALRESKIPEAFDMGGYTQADIAGGDDVVKDPFKCNTPACALGHYAARIDLQNAFAIAPIGDPIVGIHTTLVHKADNTPAGYPYTAQAHYDNLRTLAHFGIKHDVAECFFGAEGCGGAQTTIEAAEFIESACDQYERGDWTPEGGNESE